MAAVITDPSLIVVGELYRVNLKHTTDDGLYRARRVGATVVLHRLEGHDFSPAAISMRGFRVDGYRALHVPVPAWPS